LSPSSIILLDDGNIELEVLKISDKQITAMILNSGFISDKKKVSIPDSATAGLPAVSETDREDIIFGTQHGIDFVAASFVRSSDDVMDVRRVLEEAGSSARIIAKIESSQGVMALDQILKTADGLMVARGDLGVQYPPEDIPVLQKKMIAECNKIGKPVITATQMLESMIEKPRPTRAEASDVANAIIDGTDAVMLSGETAYGKYPVESVEFMAKIALRADEFLDSSVFFSRISGVSTNVTESVSRSAVSSALDLGASAIITPTESGYTARMVSRFRPGIPIFAVSPHDETCGWLSCVWGVEAVLGPSLTDSLAGGASFQYRDISDMAIDVLRKKGCISSGDLCVVTKGVPMGISGTTNVMEIRTAGDVLLKGSGIGQTSASGEVVVATSAQEAVACARQGCILVVPSANKSFIPALERASALIIEQGGLTSDGAIFALQLGIPAVVGASGATSTLNSGDIVTVDAIRGLVYAGMAKVK
jgi:pyruvate kinase